MPDTPPRLHALCRYDELAHGESREFPLPDGDTRSVFAIRHQQRIYVYLNRCPHTGAPLNWGNDQFLNFDRSLIQCTLHGAQFRIENGLCIWGPCLRQHLTALPVRVEKEMVWIDLGTLAEPAWRAR
ncbi:MAG: Rieske (2Fe-2S) protein [Pseudomonadota bacterium]